MKFKLFMIVFINKEKLSYIFSLTQGFEKHGSHINSFIESVNFHFFSKLHPQKSLKLTLSF